MNKETHFKLVVEYVEQYPEDLDQILSLVSAHIKKFMEVQRHRQLSEGLHAAETGTFFALDSQVSDRTYTAGMVDLVSVLMSGEESDVSHYAPATISSLRRFYDLVNVQGREDFLRFVKDVKGEASLVIVCRILKYFDDKKV